MLDIEALIAAVGAGLSIIFGLIILLTFSNYTQIKDNTFNCTKSHLENINTICDQYTRKEK